MKDQKNTKENIKHEGNKSKTLLKDKALNENSKKDLKDKKTTHNPRDNA